MKSRIVTIAGATRGSGRDESGRPTLKRRPQTTSDDDKGDSKRRIARSSNGVTIRRAETRPAIRRSKTPNNSPRRPASRP